MFRSSSIASLVLAVLSTGAEVSAQDVQLTAPAEAEVGRAPRVAFELAGGAALATAGGLAGLVIASELCDANMDTDTWFGCLGERIAGVGGGYILGSTLGVWGAGTLAGGDGHLGYVALGEAAGFGAALALSPLLLDHETDNAPAVIAMVVLPVVGAVLGFELSASDPAGARRPQITPSVAVSDSSAEVGLHGSF